ncbi:MAG: hypothetical protein ABIZ56_09370, partial [Chthoniobacteraceae bacterium]
PAKDAVPPAINFVIVYEDFATGIHAKHFAEMLAATSGADCGAMPLWRSEILEMPEFADDVARQAAESDYVILALRGDIHISFGVKNWIEAWLALAVAGPSCLVALLHSPRTSTSSAARYYLRNVTAAAGIDFFAHSTVASGEEPILDLPILEEAIVKPLPPRAASRRSELRGILIAA